MAYIAPKDFAAKMVDADESKIFMATKDTLIRAFMAGAILALAAGFAVTIALKWGLRHSRCRSVLFDGSGVLRPFARQKL